MSRHLAPLRIAAELALMFAVLYAFDRWTGSTGFAQVNPNPYWLPVLAASLAYGAGPGFAAALIASALWMIAGHPPLALGEDPFDRLIALTMPPVLWVAGSALIGEVTSLRLKRLERRHARGEALDRNIRLLIGRYRKLAHTNRELQVRIAASDRGVSAALAEATMLIDADPIAYARVLVRLIAIAADSENFTLYIADPSGSHRFAAGAAATRAPEQLPEPLLAAMGEDHRVRHVGEADDRPLLGDVGILALPLAAPSGALNGVLVIHDLPLDRLTRPSVAALADVAAWLAPLLARGLPASRSDDSPARLRLVPAGEAS